MPQSAELLVETAHATYPIHVGRHLSQALAAEVRALIGKGARVAAVVDANVRAAQADWLAELPADVASVTVPSGETSKSVAQLEAVLDFLAAQKLDRGGVVLAIGGGVVGDLAGFAAASYLRGVRFIQIPTTLLAMVDSSVGGKTGINLAAGKNLVGAFHQPIAVYSDLELLRTLPPREFAAGMAEIIKHGLLADAELFELLERAPLLDAGDPRLEAIVARNCRIKAGVVAADEQETASSGGRALLNLGHTFGHAIENAAGYGEYLHGEAVAVGLAAAAELSRRLGNVSQDDVARIQKAIAAHKLPTRLRAPLPLDKLLAAMRLDKKTKAGSVRFVVLRAIGAAETVESADPDAIREIWRALGATG